MSTGSRQRCLQDFPVSILNVLDDHVRASQRSSLLICVVAVACCLVGLQRCVGDCQVEAVCYEPYLPRRRRPCMDYAKGRLFENACNDHTHQTRQRPNNMGFHSHSYMRVTVWVCLFSPIPLQGVLTLISCRREGDSLFGYVGLSLKRHYLNIYRGLNIISQ